MIRPIFTVSDLAPVPNDGKRYEILEGDLIVSPSPNCKHQRIVLNCADFLHAVERAGYGQVYGALFDVVLDHHDVTEPDLLFSSSSRERDLGLKARLYARFGVNEYGVVDPEAETLTV